MTDEISRCLKKIGTELENVNKALNSIWYSRYQNGETDVLDPRCHADEYITLEVCAKRLHVTPQTIRNWIKIGMQPAPTPNYQAPAPQPNVCLLYTSPSPRD